jgi:hypothetical protein
MTCGERRNEIQDISEGVSFVEFLRETSCPLWLRARGLTVVNERDRLFSSISRRSSELGLNAPCGRQSMRPSYTRRQRRTER